jgi:hypothetical protein
MEATWDLSAGTLDRYYAQVVNYLDQNIADIRVRRKRFKRPAFVIRALALGFACAGVLLPLLYGPGDFFRSRNGVEAGYIAFAIGALLLLVDQVFAISTSWSRLRLSELQLAGLRNDLEFDWAKQRPLLDSAQDKIASAQALLDLLKDAKSKAHLVNESQMKSWISELAEGHSVLSTKVGTAK